MKKRMLRIILFQIFILTFFNNILLPQDWTAIRFDPGIRNGHAMADLGAGKVLMFGGYHEIGWSKYNYLSDTWIFDLSLGSWKKQNLETLPTGRYGHAMADLGEGKVLMFGGFNGTTPNNETWIYDFNTGGWQQLTNIISPSPRRFHAMARIGDGKVLLFGGRTATQDRNRETWMFDINVGSWTQITPVISPTMRSNHAMAYIGNNKVLLFGGYASDGRNNDTWIYDLTTGNWSQDNIGTSPMPNESPKMSYIADNKVVLFGGYTSGINNETWIYDITTGNWFQDININAPIIRGNHSITFINESKIILFGGYTYPPGSPNSTIRLNDTWIYDLNSGDWNKVPSYLYPNPHGWNPIMTKIDNDKVFSLINSYPGTRYQTWIYDFSDNIWSMVPFGEYLTSRNFAMECASYIGDDKVILFGGMTNKGYVNETWIYDLSDNNWYRDSIGLSPSYLRASSMAYLGDKKIIMFGGYNYNTWPIQNLNETWIYDLDNNSWYKDEDGQSPSPRSYSYMSYIGNNKVLMYGGQTANEFSNETWIYDLNNGNWNMISCDVWPSVGTVGAMSYLGENKVILFGGSPRDGSDYFTNETWIFDLQNNSWTLINTDTRQLPRRNHVIANVGKNRVLMFGGTTPVSQNNDLWCFSIPYTNNPPIALCKEVAVSTDANTCTAVASIDNGSSDPDGDQITLIQTPPGPYTVGTTNVTLTVTDNQGESSSCTGIVTVVDDKAPVVRTQDPTVTLINGIATITASDVDNGSSDNCGIASMTVSPNSFNCTSTGDQTVILTVTDVNGNVTTETARVLVLGETPSVSIDVNPEYTIWGEEPYTIYLGYGAQSITLTVLGGISYSWSSNPTGTISNSQSITVSPTVTTEYFVTVTNQYGCSDSKSIEINVVDWRCGNGDHKIRICHNGHVICVDTHAVAAHMEHGDNIGDCRSYKDTYEEAETLSSGGDEFTVKLKQNSPNPFNYMTEIQYFVSQREHVSLILTDITGKVVANLIDSYVPPSWNTLIINGSGLTPGVYLVRIESQGKSDMMKIIKAE